MGRGKQVAWEVGQTDKLVLILLELSVCEDEVSSFLSSIVIDKQAGRPETTSYCEKETIQEITQDAWTCQEHKEKGTRILQLATCVIVSWLAFD